MTAVTPERVRRVAVTQRSERPVPVRHYGQILAGIVVLVLLVAFVTALVNNEKLDYSVIAANLTAPAILRGLGVTLMMSVLSMALGSILGVLIALARMSDNVLLRGLGGFYVWFFRGVPLLVQIIIWGNFALLFPVLGIGIPFTDIMFFSVPTNAVLTTFVAACVALTLHEAAYMAEVVRSGILAVDIGQVEAARALGMPHSLAMRRIVLPQAMRVIIPPTGNQFITLLKSSAMVSVIAGGDLMTAVSDIGSANFRIIETLFIAVIWYLLVVTVLSAGQRILERRLSRGYAR